MCVCVYINLAYSCVCVCSYLLSWRSSACSCCQQRSQFVEGVFKVPTTITLESAYIGLYKYPHSCVPVSLHHIAYPPNSVQLCCWLVYLLAARKSLTVKYSADILCICAYVFIFACILCALAFTSSSNYLSEVCFGALTSKAR